MSISRTDISFRADAGTAIGGWLFLPERVGPHPAITMSAGFGGTIHHGLEPFAVAFAEAGFAVLLHDHRGFGSSDGLPRHDVDPWRQIADWRRAISYLEGRPEVDAKRIGLWGTSYSGGHAIMLGASDRRLKAVVAQVPTISGYEQGLRRIPADQLAAVDEALAQDDRNQLDGEPGYQALVGADPAVPAAYRSQDAIDFMLRPVPEGGMGEYGDAALVASGAHVRARRLREPRLADTDDVYRSAGGRGDAHRPGARGLPAGARAQASRPGPRRPLRHLHRPAVRGDRRRPGVVP